MTNSNSNPIASSKGSNCPQDPSVQLTQLDWLGNLSNLLRAAEDCFITNTDEFYSENMRAWNTSAGGAAGESEDSPYPERGPHKLPNVCSLTWRAGRWEVHLLIRDFMEVIEGLFADGRLNVTRPQNPESGASGASGEVYLAGDFEVQRRGSATHQHYYELSYTPVTMNSIRMFALVDQEELGNTARALERYGIHIKWEE